MATNFARVMLAASFSVACGAPPGGYERLKSEPEASLVFPGSERLADGGYDAEYTTTGRHPAEFWLQLGTDASLDEIREFYEAELAGRVWQPAPSGRSSTEVSGYRWRRGGLDFRLGFLDTEIWYSRLEGSDRFATLYEIRLIEEVAP